MTRDKFITEGKSLETDELRSGDLIVSGYGAVWHGLDFENENFARNSFRETIPSFLAGPAPLVFNHDTGRPLGRVLSLEEDDVGLKLKARVDYQEPGSPLRHIYNAIKRKSYKGLSASGFFKRAMTAGGKRIVNVRLVEFSVAPVAVHPGAALSSVEVKALGLSRDAALRATEQRLVVAQATLAVLQLRHLAQTL